MSTHIINGPSFIWGITGVLVPGYRVEERADDWAIAVASDGREYLISKTEDGFRLTRQEVGEWDERIVGGIRGGL